MIPLNIWPLDLNFELLHYSLRVCENLSMHLYALSLERFFIWPNVKSSNLGPRNRKGRFILNQWMRHTVWQLLAIMHTDPSFGLQSTLNFKKLFSKCTSLKSNFTCSFLVHYFLLLSKFICVWLYGIYHLELASHIFYMVTNKGVLASKSSYANGLQWKIRLASSHRKSASLTSITAEEK